MLDAAEENTSLDVVMVTNEYGPCSNYDDGYRMRNLWIDMLVGAYNRGLPTDAAADAADTAVARYKAKFDVK